MQVPFSTMGHIISQDIGKTIPALPEQSFLQRDTKVRGLRGVFCCCLAEPWVWRGSKGWAWPVLHLLQHPGDAQGYNRGQIPDALPSLCLFPARRAVFAFPFPPVSSMASEMGPWRGFAPSPPCRWGTFASRKLLGAFTPPLSASLCLK